jgi:molybdopterin converting factor small subunit
MSIKIKIPEYLQDKTDGESLGALVHRYPALKGEMVDAQGVLLLKWLIAINNKIVSISDDLSNAVTDGDVIMLVPMIAGG